MLYKCHFYIKLVDGGDRADDILPDIYETIWNIVGFLVRPCLHLYSTGKVAIIYSGFCVLKGIIEIKKLGF